MSKKLNYLNILKRYSEQENSINTKLNNIINSEAYTDDYKKEARNKTQDEIKQLKDKTSQELLDILHMALNDHEMAVTTAIKERLENVNYQTGINSLVASIQANAISVDEWKNLGQTYLIDSVAVKRINKAITECGNKLSPLTYREDKTEQYLKQIENNIHTYIANHYADDKLTIVGMIDFIEKRLDDNMAYVNEE